MYHLGCVFPKLPKQSGRLFINLYVTRIIYFSFPWFGDSSETSNLKNEYQKHPWTHKKNNVSPIHLLIASIHRPSSIVVSPGVVWGKHIFLPELLHPFGRQMFRGFQLVMKSKFEFRSADLWKQNHLSSLHFRGSVFFNFIYLGWIMPPDSPKSWK